MRNVKTYFLAAASCLLVAGSLQAQTATGQMKWVGVNGSWGAYNNTGTGAAMWNVYTSPYLAKFKIPTLPTNQAQLPPALAGGFGPTADIFCVDFNHYANTGTSNVFFTNLGTGGGYLGTYTRSNNITKYLAAAYLSQQIIANPSNSGLLNGAIWQIMSGQPNYYKNGNTWQSVTATANSAMTYATNHGNDYKNDWVVVTEGYKTIDRLGHTQVTLGDHQEFLVHVTPEPATLLLLGTGLVVMLLGAGAFRRQTVL